MDNPKFQNSCTFCFQCSHWQDKSDNGIGICTDPESPYNGQPVHAMNKCECKHQTTIDYQIIVRDSRQNRINYIQQANKEEAWSTAKALGMEYIEALSKDVRKIDLQLHFDLDQKRIEIQTLEPQSKYISIQVEGFSNIQIDHLANADSE